MKYVKHKSFWTMVDYCTLIDLACDIENDEGGILDEEMGF